MGAERPQALATNRSFSQRYQLNSKLLSPLKTGVLGRNKQTRFLPEIRSEYGWGSFQRSLRASKWISETASRGEGRAKGNGSSKKEDGRTDLQPEKTRTHQEMR